MKNPRVMFRLTNRIFTGAVILSSILTGMGQMAHTGRMIDGIAGPNFTLTAKQGVISTGDGNSVFIWGFANGSTNVQYPGPTMLVKQGDLVTVTLNNTLPVPVSILFPGQTKVSSAGGEPGAITREAPPGGSVSYSFLAAHAGTYLYNSGTRPDLQVEMGLIGALIVRPTNTTGMQLAHQAYGHANTSFDHEFLFLLSEMDERIHDLVEQGRIAEVDMTKREANYWFINGRTGPDTMLGPRVSWMPTQPYNCMPMFHPGQKVLMRMIGAGSDPHPFHHHGNHSQIIAKEGRLLESVPGAGPDLAYMVFTLPVTPGSTMDALFSWTGEKLGWDVYGHSPSAPLAPNEYAPDHGKPMPVELPTDQELTFGQMYGGSPFLGKPANLPPGQGGFNPGNAFSYMWHSHAEKELCNNNLFPGGMMTMIMIEAHPPGEPMP
ncbi:MAG TPA: multicopper oxidase domain-containing protein [Clostridia bacterium]|nr:multicopper oxidase domain-containing protein [Clostridia bacterium]